MVRPLPLFSLSAAKADKARSVVSVTIYLSRYDEDFASMNEVYFGLFPEGVARPCRTCVGVALLPAGTDIEVTCVAAKRG